MWWWLQNHFLSDFRWFYDWEVQDLLAKKEALNKIQENYFFLESEVRSPIDVPGGGTGGRAKWTNQSPFNLFPVLLDVTLKIIFKWCRGLTVVKPRQVVIAQISWVWEQTKKGLCHHSSRLISCCPRKNVRQSLESLTQGKMSGSPCKSMTAVFVLWSCGARHNSASWVPTSSSFLSCSFLTPSFLPEQSMVLTCCWHFCPCLFWKYPWAYVDRVCMGSPGFSGFPLAQGLEV